MVTKALIIAALVSLWPMSNAWSQSNDIPVVNTQPTLAWDWDAWSLALQGFLQTDFIWDSTQSFGDVAGNGIVARPQTYAGDHSRLMFSARNSRLNVQFAHTARPFKSSARLEVDFLGTQSSTVTEAVFFENPTLRLRHFYATLEFDHVEVLIGQTWQLLGSQPMPQVSTPLILGVPGMLYGRAPQVRLQGTETAERLQFSWAAAASRPPSRDAGVPDGQVSLRFADLKHQGVHTVGAIGTEIMPLTLGITGVIRGFAAPADAEPGARELRAMGYGWSLDAFVPLIADVDTRAHNLSLTMSYVGGAGIADMFTGLSGGAPAVSTIDAGVVGVDTQGALHPIEWQVVLIGLQYYLPPEGQVWVSLNGSYMLSNNVATFSKATAAFKEAWWGEFNIMADLSASVRMGVDVSCTWQRNLDEVIARNLRGQVSAFYIF